MKIYKEIEIVSEDLEDQLNYEDLISDEVGSLCGEVERCFKEYGFPPDNVPKWEKWVEKSKYYDIQRKWEDLIMDKIKKVISEDND